VSLVGVAIRAAHLGPLNDFADAHHLSGRETEVLRRAAEGLSMKEIAFELGISTKTVEKYWCRIYEKTGQISQMAVMALMFRWCWPLSGRPC
jgi:DNA-binding NarL/FixJ family response regulator